MRVHSLVTFLTMGLTVFSACVWAEDSAGEYFMLKCSDGVMRKVRLPGKGAVRFPLFPDDGAREQAAERDAACRLLPRQVPPESELSRLVIFGTTPDTRRSKRPTKATLGLGKRPKSP